MALPQHLTYGIGGLVTLDLRDPPAAVTYKIVKGDGTEVQGDTDANVSISSVNTTLNCAPVRGDRALNVASNVGLTYGVRVYLQDSPEEVLVEKRSGETITLIRPLLRDHANGSYVQGTLVNISLGANVANSLWWDGHIEANVDGEKYFCSLECTRYPTRRMAGEQDLFDIEPLLCDVLNAEEDPKRLLDAAHEFVLRELGKAAPDRRVRVFVGSSEFTACTALAAMYLHYRRRATEEAQTLADRYHKDFVDALASTVGTTPRDANQDQVIRPDEAMTLRGGRLVR